MFTPQHSIKKESFTLTQAIGLIVLIISAASAAFVISVITVDVLFWGGHMPLRNTVFLWTNLLGHGLLIGAGMKLLRRKSHANSLYIAGLGILTLSAVVSPFPDVGVYLFLGWPAVLIYGILGIGLFIGKRIEMAHRSTQSTELPSV